MMVGDDGWVEDVVRWWVGGGWGMMLGDGA